MKNSVGTTEKIKTEESEDNKMKNLKTLQTLSKMGKILSRIAFVFAMIGACGCIIGLSLMFWMHMRKRRKTIEV